MPAEASQEVTETVPEPFLKKTIGGGDHNADDAFAGIEHEDEAPKALPEAEEGAKVQRKPEDIDEEPPSTPAMAKVGPLLARVILHLYRCSGVHFLVTPLFSSEVEEDYSELNGVPVSSLAEL